MSHWRNVLTGEVFDINYEELVENVEDTGRRMAEFCGLEWHKEMARPDLNTEQVLTLSATQLHRPVHTGSIGKWRKNADLLASFVEDLDPNLWGDYLNA